MVVNSIVFCGTESIIYGKIIKINYLVYGVRLWHKKRNEKTIKNKQTQKE